MKSTLVGYLLMLFVGVSIGMLIDQMVQPAPQAQVPPPPVAQPPHPAPAHPADPAKDDPATVAERRPASPPAAEAPSAQSPPAGVPGGAPKLLVEAPKFDFGELERGEKTEHTFVVHNVGTAPLEITKIHSDHHWIVADPPALSIPPGQKAELKVKLEPAREWGRVNGQIVMKTNDPATPTRHLMIVGNVTTKVKLDPPRIDFGVPSGNEPVSRVFKVTGQRGLTFKIEKTQTSGEALAAEVRVVTPGDEYEVTATLDPTRLAGGKFHGWIHLLTDQRGEYHVIPIPVSAGHSIHPAER